jgi:hypothetical protein
VKRSAVPADCACTSCPTDPSSSTTANPTTTTDDRSIDDGISHSLCGPRKIVGPGPTPARVRGIIVVIGYLNNTRSRQKHRRSAPLDMHGDEA